MSRDATKVPAWRKDRFLDEAKRHAAHLADLQIEAYNFGVEDAQDKTLEKLIHELKLVVQTESPELSKACAALLAKIAEGWRRE